LIFMRILLVEDDPDDVAHLRRHLKQAGLDADLTVVEDEPGFERALTQPLDVILCDHNLPRFSAPRALELLQQRGLEIPFIVVSGSVGEDTAVHLMRLGASDYLLKDRLARLGPAVLQAWRQGAAQRARQSSERDIRLLLGLMKEATATHDFATLLQRTVEIIVSEAGWDYADVWVPQPDGETMRWSGAAAGDRERYAEMLRAAPGLSFPRGVGVPGKVLALRSTVIEREFPATSSPRALLAGQHGLRSALGVPILDPRQELVAAVICFSRNPLSDDRRIVELAASISSELGATFERLRSRAALIDQEHFIASLAERMPGTLYQFRMDAQGEFSFPYISPGIEPMCGLTPEQVMRDASCLLGATHPEDLQRVLDSSRASARSGVDWDECFRVRGADGEYRWIQARSRPRRSPLDGSVLWDGVFLEINDPRM
jgi:CheY-like chemotaxis protein